MSKPGKSKNIYLTGFMGAGKSTVGPRLARRLKWRYVDTDQVVEKKARLTISNIFERQGEKRFRRLEAQVIARIAQKEKQVVSLGGGALLNSQTRKRLKKTGTLVYLKASPAVLHRRLAHKGNRPLLEADEHQTRLERIRFLLEKRRKLYESADQVIVTNKKTVQAIVKSLEQRLMR